MNRIFSAIFLGLLIIGLFIPMEYTFANSLEDYYLSIKLTSPIKSKNIVKLYSEDGFAIYRKDDILNEVECFETKNIDVCSGDEDDIVIFDALNNILFSFYESEDLIITSRNVYDRKIKIEDKYYRDFVNFKIIGNELKTLNYVKLDNYLYGVVPCEMPASFPMEALKAQAIAARTYALKNINKHINEVCNLCDTTHCQVYGGIDGEHERTKIAVDETSGLVITYNGDIIEALYHSNSGGYTEDSMETWGNSVPYLKAVNDEFSSSSPNSDWSFTMTIDEINNRLNKSGIRIGNVVDMKVLETSLNGRVSKLKVVGTLGEEVLNKTKIRQVLGTTELKSTWFTIKREGSKEYSKTVYAIDGENINPQLVDLSNSHIIDGKFNKKPTRGFASGVIDRENISEIGNTNISTSNTGSFIIEGKGYGHGVGMSQWGAKGMAESGYSFEEILKHYYTGVEIIKQN